MIAEPHLHTLLVPLPVRTKRGVTSNPSPLLDAGGGVQEFTAVVNVADQPAWLKRLVLRFAVLFSGTMDAAGRSGSGAGASASPVETPGASLFGGAPNLEQRGPSAAAAERTAMADEWLPAALQPRKAGEAKRKQQKRVRREPQAGSQGLAAAGGASGPEPRGDAPAERGSPYRFSPAEQGTVRRGHGGSGASASGQPPAAPPGVDRLGGGPPMYAARGAGGSAGAMPVSARLLISTV